MSEPTNQVVGELPSNSGASSTALLARRYAFPLPHGGNLDMTIVARAAVSGGDAGQLREFFGIVVDGLLARTGDSAGRKNQAGGTRVIAYKLMRPDCGGWMCAGTTPEEVANVVKNEIEGDAGGVVAGQEIHLVAYETTQEEIDSLPEFQGW